VIAAFVFELRGNHAVIFTCSWSALLWGLVPLALEYITGAV
jgi:hypothetical protein